MDPEVLHEISPKHDHQGFLLGNLGDERMIDIQPTRTVAGSFLRFLVATEGVGAGVFQLIAIVTSTFSRTLSRTKATTVVIEALNV